MGCPRTDPEMVLLLDEPREAVRIKLVESLPDLLTKAAGRAVLMNSPSALLTPPPSSRATNLSPRGLPNRQHVLSPTRLVHARALNAQAASKAPSRHFLT